MTFVLPVTGDSVSARAGCGLVGYPRAPLRAPTPQASEASRTQLHSHLYHLIGHGIGRGGKCIHYSQNCAVFWLPPEKRWDLFQPSADFSEKPLNANIFGFRDQLDDLGAVTYLCLCSVKAATDDRQTQMGVAAF